MPMDRARYPDNWEEIAMVVKNLAGWRCACCGLQCRRPGERLDTHKRTLTVHHLDHNPANCEINNLVALCAPCHLRAEGEWKRENQKKGGGYRDADGVKKP